MYWLLSPQGLYKTNYSNFYINLNVYVCILECWYLEWWLDSNLHLVLFIQYILNSVSVAYIYIYICIIWEVVNSSERWLIHAEWWLSVTTSVGRTLILCDSDDNIEATIYWYGRNYNDMEENIMILYTVG